METRCPHCGGNVSPDARYCPHCSRLAKEFQYCPECAEPIASAAKRCPCCGQKVPTQRDLQARSFRKSITASRIGAFLTTNPTSLLHPPRLEVADGRIRMTKWSFLGLRVHQQEIRIDRVASVKYTKGVIWGELLVETFGGATEDVCQKGFPQTQARDMAQELKEMIGA